METINDSDNILSDSIARLEATTAESADLTEADLEGASVGSVIVKDNAYYMVTENGAELLGEDTSESDEPLYLLTEDDLEEVSVTSSSNEPTAYDKTHLVSIFNNVGAGGLVSNSYMSGFSTSDNGIVSGMNVAGSVATNQYASTYYNGGYNTSYSGTPTSISNTPSYTTNQSTNQSKSTTASKKTTQGIVSVGTVLSIGGIFYLVIDGGIKCLGKGDPVPSGEDGPPIVINIYNEIQVTEINNTQTYVYNKVDKIIKNYEVGQLVKLDLSKYNGIDLNGQSFFINTESGKLEIKDSRDKFIGYTNSDDNIVAYSYLASGGGTIDGRDKSQAEIMIGGDNADNNIIAGNGGSSLWGGNGGADTLVGGDGYDEFFYAIGSGNDNVQNASSSDMINLLGVSLNQITAYSYDETSVSLAFADGGSLRVENNSMIGYKVEDTTYTFNHATGEWTTNESHN